METKLLKRALPTISAMFAAGQVGIASAHTLVGSLGASTTAIDYYQVTCSDDGNGNPTRLDTEITGISGPSVSAVTLKDNAAVITIGPRVPLSKGSGNYSVLVHKCGAAGSASYTLGYYCMTGTFPGGVQTGTAIATKQNQ